MATGEILEDFQELNTCDICLHSYEHRDPRALSCLHVFCLDCIQRVYEKDQVMSHAHKKVIQCPVCRRETNLTTDSVIELPRYFLAEKLQDVIDKHKKFNIPCIETSMPCKTPCSICGEAMVTVFCFTCTQALCGECQGVHDTRRGYQHHVKVPVNNDSMSSLICTEHDHPVEAFCTQCLVPVCKRCQGTNHKQHSIEDFCINLNHPEEITDERYVHLSERLEAINKIQQEFNRHIMAIVNDISLQKAKLIKQLDDQEQQMCSEITKHQMETNEYIGDIKNQIKESIGHHKTNTNRHELLQKPLGNFPHVTLQDVDKWLAKDKDVPDMDNWTVNEPKSYDFAKESETIMLGYLTPSLHTDKPSKDSIKSKSNATRQRGMFATLQARLNSATQPLASASTHLASANPPLVPPVAPLISSISPFLSKNSQAGQAEQQPQEIWHMQYGPDSNIKDIAYFSNGDLLSIKTTKEASDLVLHDKNGESKPLPFVSAILSPLSVAVHNPTSYPYRASLSSVLPQRSAAKPDMPMASRYIAYLSRLGSLHSVAAEDKPNCVVAIGHGQDPCYSVTVFTLSNGTWDSVVFTVDGKPSSIEFTTAGHIIICSIDDQTLTKYQANGIKLWEERMHFSKPGKLTVDRQKRILVSFFQSGLVRIYQDNGRCRPIYDYPQKSYRRLLKSPSDLCTDTHANFLVADTVQQSVLMFNSLGSFVKEVINVPGQPVCLALNQDRYLAVGTNEGTLYCYKI